MKYRNVINGKWIRRINRFVAHVWVEHTQQVVHVKNTGRCEELFLPGADVLLEKSENPGRKTPFSLIAVYKGEQLVNVDSQAPNRTVYEALSAGEVREIGNVEHVKTEVAYGHSRFDLYFESGGQKALLEVKGVTLEREGVALFPDAPTARGTRHIYGLIDAVANGYAGYLLFLVQMKGVRWFAPNRRTDAEFAEALVRAAEKGVRILAYDSVVRRDEIRLGDPVEIRL